MPVIAGHRLRGRADPIEQPIFRNVECSLFNNNVEPGLANQNS